MDDAVLSLGQHILEWKKQGKKVRVVTVFTKFGDGKNLPEYTADYMEKSGFNSVVYFEKARVKEDVEAMEMMGVEWEHWDLVDAGFRGNYLTREELLGGEIKKEDKELVEKIVEKIKKCGADEIYLPFGVGGHVDHWIVRTAGERSRKNIKYYLESPYLWQRLNFIKYLKYFKKLKFPNREKDGFLKCYKSQYLLLKQNVWWPLIEIINY